MAIPEGLVSWPYLFCIVGDGEGESLCLVDLVRRRKLAGIGVPGRDGDDPSACSCVWSRVTSFKGDLAQYRAGGAGEVEPSIVDDISNMPAEPSVGILLFDAKSDMYEPFRVFVA